MKYALLTLFLVMNSFSSMAQSDIDFEIRKAWVETLKDLAMEIESSGSEELYSDEEMSFLRKLSFISSAYAIEEYGCLFAGWPSKRRHVGNRDYCTSPKNGNDEYQQGSCSKNKLNCQPLLFNENLCVPFVTKTDKQYAFSNCEKEFKKQKRNYDFLKEPGFTKKNADKLVELSKLAAEICHKKFQSKTPMCRLVEKRLPEALHALNLEQSKTAGSTSTVGDKPEPQKNISSNSPEFKPDVLAQTKLPQTPTNSHTSNKEEAVAVDCPPETPFKNVVSNADQITKTANTNLNQLYEKLKTNFLNSSMCRPANVVNDPKEKGSLPLLSVAFSDIMFFVENDTISPNVKMPKFKKLSEKYQLPDELAGKIKDILQKMDSYQNFDSVYRKWGNQARMMVAQYLINKSKSDPSYMKDEITKKLVKDGIFKVNSNGQEECPFLSREVFDKAMAGRDEVLKKHQFGKKNVFTIIDYTMPSNQRRLFTLDLSAGNERVIHNTWLAHGRGGYGAKGNNGLGSIDSTDTSNTSRTNKTSEGFIIVSTPERGEKWGNNLLLNGIDVANSNMSGRAIVLHGWPAPYSDADQGMHTLAEGSDFYETIPDGVGPLLKIDPNTASADQMSEAFSELKGHLEVSSYIPATDGCLGVPLTKATQVDEKHRNMTQLEMLRADLPNSLMFSYTGPGMKSQFD